MVAETLRDVVHTWNIFIVGDPKGRELDEIRLGPQELRAAKEQISLAAPIIDALRQSNNVATERAKQAAAEQAEAAKDAPTGINGDQAIDLSQKTTRNIVIELVRRCHGVRTAGGFSGKEIVAGAFRRVGADVVAGAEPRFVAFFAQISDALKNFVSHAWQGHALNQIVDFILRAFNAHLPDRFKFGAAALGRRFVSGSWLLRHPRPARLGRSAGNESQGRTRGKSGERDTRF